MRDAAPAARKLHVSEPAGHQSGRRVWKSGPLRSERKDLCESRDFNAILKGLAAPAQDLILRLMRQPHVLAQLLSLIECDCRQDERVRSNEHNNRRQHRYHSLQTMDPLVFLRSVG